MSKPLGAQLEPVLDGVLVQVIERSGILREYFIPRQVSMVLGWNADGDFGVVAGGSGGSGDLSDTAARPLGTAAAGTGTEASRADHVHPTQFGRQAVANNTGNETITPSTTTRRHKVEATFGGSAGTRILILDTAARLTGDSVRLALNLPATNAVIVEVRDATAGGTLLATITATADGTRRAIVDVEFNGTAFIKEFVIDPA